MLLKLVTKAAVALLAVDGVFAAPTEPRQSKCTTTKKRKAWHTLTDAEKKAYIDAELCMMSLPTDLNLRGARTKFDEFQSVHVLSTETAHFVGSFLPWHRLYIHAHEKALETHCGYTGAQPYWQEQHDAGKFTKSDVLDPVTGFGGSGKGTSQCITDGPFVNYTNPLGPGYQITDHCIQRQVSDMMSQGAMPREVDRCVKQSPTYLRAWNCIEGAPHAAGHGGIGAQMLNPASSAGDPIFHLHHAWIDKLWWDWQALNLTRGLAEMGGRNQWDRAANGTRTPPMGAGAGIPRGGFGGGANPLARPADVPEPKIIGDPGAEVTMDHLIQMYGLVPDRTVGEIMDIRNDVLCYEYVEPPPE